MINSSHTIEVLFTASPALARLLIHFYYCPAEYLHPSRRGEFQLGGMDERVWKTQRALPFISAHILDELQLPDITSFSLSYAGWPLALSSAAELKRLQQHITAVLYEEAIRRCLLTKDILKWRSLIGHDAYKFALTGTKLLPKLGIRCHTDIYEAGAVTNSWIVAAMSTAPEPISTLAKLKIPPTAHTELVDSNLAQRFISSLISILEPKWCLLLPTTLT
jgi:hypothetical protein